MIPRTVAPTAMISLMRATMAPKRVRNNNMEMNARMTCYDVSWY